MEKAIFWYRASANQGVVEAQYALGDIYRKGDAGTPDPIEAGKWLGLAALLEKPEAIHDFKALAKTLNEQDLAEIDRRMTEWWDDFEARAAKSGK